MKKQLFLFCAAMMTAGTLSALLPPLAESKKEVLAILNSEELTKALTMDQLITAINKTDDGYVVITNKCSLHVDVVYQPQNMAGPAKFELKFHDAACKPQ